MTDLKLYVVSHRHTGLGVSAILASLVLASCGGGGGGLKVGDCTDVDVGGHIGAASPPKKLDCNKNYGSRVAKVKSGNARSGSCAPGEQAVDDPDASGKYLCLSQK